MNISEKLKNLRAKTGLSQEKVAEQLLVSRQAISKWENGEAMPDLENLKAISKFYNVSIDYILESNDKIQSANDPEEPRHNVPDTKKMNRWKRWYNAARICLIAVAAITAINYVLKLLNVFTFALPFGASFPGNFLYYGMTYSGRNHTMNEILEVTGGYTYSIPDILYYVILVFTIMIVLAYIACAVFSGKNRGEFFVIALILWIGDILYGIVTNAFSMIMKHLMGITSSDFTFDFYLAWTFKICFVAMLIIGIIACNKIHTAERQSRASA